MNIGRSFWFRDKGFDSMSSYFRGLIHGVVACSSVQLYSYKSSSRIKHFIFDSWDDPLRPVSEINSPFPSLQVHWYLSKSGGGYKPYYVLPVNDVDSHEDETGTIFGKSS